METKRTLKEALICAYDCGQLDAGHYNSFDSTAEAIIDTGIIVYEVFETFVGDDGCTLQDQTYGIYAIKEVAEDVAARVEELSKYFSQHVKTEVCERIIKFMK